MIGATVTVARMFRTGYGRVSGGGWFLTIWVASQTDP
jgi:hypothetical protein